MNRPRALAALLLGAVAAAGSSPAAISAARETPLRIVAVGDLHGDHERFLAVLRDAGVVDGKGRWIGGRTRLVQVGDRVDRGPDSRRIMDFLMGLEKPARRAGGAVHPLVGNHEAMNVFGDLRYVTAEEFAAFRTPESSALRDALFASLREVRRVAGEPPLTEAERTRWEAEHPPGWVEHRRAHSPDGRYGRWLAGQDAVLKLGDTLFLHGGLSPKYADFSLDDLNDRIRRELKEGDPRLAVVSSDPEGPLWFRGLARGDPALVPTLDAVLARHGCRRMVVGHTVTEGLVMPLYGGRLVAIDVGLAAVYGGPPAALVIEGDRALALHRGRLLPLPEGGGEPLLAYVRAVAALEPDRGKLDALAGRLAAGLSAVPAKR